MFADGAVDCRRPAFPLRQQHKFRRARGRVPDTHGSVSACRRQPSAVRVETHRGNPLHVTGPGVYLGPLARLTEPDHPVGAAEGEDAVGRAESEDSGAALPPAHDVNVLASAGIPDPDGAIESSGGQLARHRAESHRVHDSLVPDQPVPQNTFGGIPDQYGSVRPGGGELMPGAVVGECPGGVRALRQRSVGVSVLGSPDQHGLTRGRHAGPIGAEGQGRGKFAALVSPHLDHGGRPIAHAVDGDATVLAANQRRR